MIIISDLRGQLCNRIFLTAYGMALAEAANQRFAGFTLHEYAGLFPRTRRSKWMELPYRLLRLGVRLVVKILERFPGGKAFYVDVTYAGTADRSPMNPDFVAKIKQRPLTFVRFQAFMDLSKMAFPSHAAERIRTTFEINEDVKEAVRACAEKARQGADVLIGVHIRRGDYASHLDGLHFYPFEFYRKVMDALVEFFPGRKVAFLVCSNETLPMELFASLKITPGPGTVLGDLYSLGECDYIIGPPSTFSMWAAFYKRKPIYLMWEPQAPARLEDFKVPLE